ncbi:unnamed protein product [Haemonchus placei]|uniref:Reverse transcriptase domain-containing protein n=1 Tax=Haemonchus placei TaxID=6290 RepID=A0A0N4WDL1_HAEPC|nr:unnamed protein product [Haemonchus placei]
MADVERASHKIRFEEDKRDATRSLGLEDTTKYPSRNIIRILQLTRIQFGANASPFLLSMSISIHCREKEEITANTFLVNVLIGAQTVDEGLRKNVFSKIGMNLREFMSNDEHVLESTPLKDRMEPTSDAVKLLGLRWNTHEDTLGVPIKSITKKVTTKRSALRAFASTFDPLGLLIPLFIKAKIFIQNIWIKKCLWDDPFDEAKRKHGDGILQLQGRVIQSLQAIQ